ncbi:MAG: TonB-dependent receptor [Flammeovirgaceae bacterium]|nr:MAG: TonB-dependent receptor [Flammeovirgaceae bacterium]
MKRTFLLLPGILFFAGLMAQTEKPKGNNKISGVVIDANSKQPVEFATIALADAEGKIIDGAVADDKGKFTITKLGAGSYTVSISFIGYETQNIPVTLDKKDIDLGAIAFKEEAAVLNEVVVEGQRALIEERVDRTIYNAENDATTKGGDATDVLRRVPMLNVDLDGNVSLRGNSNILVLINNKPSTITASSVADALKQIPADQIKTVEVITSPSAKYDAEGSSGIINIVTKKNTLEGLTLNVDAGVGYRGSNLGLNGAYRKGKMGFSLGGFGRANYNNTGSFENRQLTQDTILNIQRADTRNNNLFGRYSLNWDYDIDKHNYLAASVRYGVRNGTSYQDDLETLSLVNGVQTRYDRANVNTIDNSGTVDLTLDYTRTFEKPSKEFSISTLYSLNNRTNDFTNISYDDNDIVDFRRRNDNKSFNQEVTLQVDYQTPIGDKQLVEFGAKEIIRKVSSDYQSFRAVGPDGDYVPETTTNAGNVFNYDQDVTAGYISYTATLPRAYSLKAGGRYEYTRIDANFQNDPEDPSLADKEIPSYGVFVPSINLSKRLKNNNTLKAAYNRRIRRPSIQFLNPNIQNPNPLFLQIGNPYLDPELTDNYELSYSANIKSTYLNFSTFFRNTTDAIQGVRQAKGDTIITTYQNIGEEKAVGLSVFGNIMVGKLTLGGGGDVYYAILDNNVADPLYAARNEGWVPSGRLFGNYKINDRWSLQAFGFYRGRQVNLQGYQGGFGTYSVAIRKDFKDKKGGFGIGFENFFTPQFRIKGVTESPTIDQTNINIRDVFSIRINFNYRFGKMSYDNQPRRRRGVNNDDLKDGGGGDMDGNMGQGQQQNGQRGSGFTGASRPVTQPVKKETVPADSTVAPVDATGTWTYTVDSGQQSSGGKLVITNTDGKWGGTIKSDRMPQEVTLTSVSVTGNNIVYTYVLNFGGNEVTITVDAIVKDDTMEGTMSFGQFRTVPIKAARNK